MKSSMDTTAIRSKAQYEAYCEEASRLISRDPNPESRDGKRLELLALLIEAYEKDRFTFEKPSPVDAILFRMEQQGLRQVDLVKYLGSRARVSEVLARKRELTLPMIRNLSEGLNIPVSVLIQRTANDT